MYGEIDLNDTVYTILQCLSHMSEKHYYGVTRLVDILRGAINKRIFSSGLNQIAVYFSR